MAQFKRILLSECIEISLQSCFVPLAKFIYIKFFAVERGFCGTNMG